MLVFLRTLGGAVGAYLARFAARLFHKMEIETVGARAPNMQRL